MAISPINIGVTPNDGNGDALRDAFTKVNGNDADLDGRVTINTTNIATNAAAIAFSGAKLRLTSDQTIPNNVTTDIAWDSESEDVGGWADLGANATRLTVPTGITQINIQAQIEWLANTVGIRRINIFKNNLSIPFTTLRVQISASVGGPTIHQIFGLRIPVVAGDFLEVSVLHTSGGNLDLGGTNDRTFFSIEGFK